MNFDFRFVFKLKLGYYKTLLLNKENVSLKLKGVIVGKKIETFCGKR